jgi:hypothetical protein
MDAQADKLRVELEELSVSMSQLRASYDELYDKHFCLNIVLSFDTVNIIYQTFLTFY